MKSFTGEEWSPPQQIKLVPDIGSFKVSPGKEFETSLSRHIRVEEQTLWITDDMPELEFAEGVSYVDMPKWAEGRRASVQGVFFGYIALSDLIETPVAVKPFLNAVSAGAHETAMLMHLRDANLPVYEVLGATWSSDQGFTMITAFEEESRSLDNVNWAKGLQQPLGSHLTNLEALEQVGQSLGLMHGNGIIHNDAQIKNFAVNRDVVVLIDLARARSVQSQDGFIDEALLRRGTFRDLSVLIDDLRKKNFLGDASRSQTASFIKNVIAPAYRSGLYRAHGQVEQQIDGYRDIVELTILDILEQYE